MYLWPKGGKNGESTAASTTVEERRFSSLPCFAEAPSEAEGGVEWAA